jgi:excisionase family DNA binding protein
VGVSSPPSLWPRRSTAGEDRGIPGPRLKCSMGTKMLVEMPSSAGQLRKQERMSGGIGDSLVMADLPRKSLLRPDEVAKFLSISKSSIYRWVDEGKLLACSLSRGSVRIFRKSVLELVEKQSTGSFDEKPKSSR